MNKFFMKVVAINKAPASFENAMSLEKQGEPEKAAAMYERLLKTVPEDMKVLSRLMIIYRKLKNYNKEISYINQAIKIYESKYGQLKSKDAKVVSLSKKLNVLLGHTDKRGKSLIAIPEVEQLKKRKAVAMKRKK